MLRQTEATSCPCAPKREPCAQLQGITRRAETQRFSFCARSSSGQYNAKAGSHLVCTSLGCFSFNSSLWLVLRTFFKKKRKKETSGCWHSSQFTRKGYLQVQLNPPSVWDSRIPALIFLVPVLCIKTIFK